MLKPKPPRRPPFAPSTTTRAADPAETGAPNDQTLSVSALASALKRTVEDRFGYVRVRGEISNYRGPHSSGHAYFSLKDDTARIDAVIWKTSFGRLHVKPEEGMDVIASGRLTTYPGKSSYQIIVDDLEPAGIGALMAALEERRSRLAAEGLFDAARKRPLPFLPAVIGVVTSPTGAVIRDILHRIAARFATRVVVWPVRVQGETSAAEITRAILGFSALEAGGLVPMPHVLIVARGGGSLEDLWGFNDEALVRAAAASRMPLISAVGHETDWTLIDHAADLRAPTPTGAAELAVPVLLDLTLAVERLAARQIAAMIRLLDDRGRAFRAAARLLPSGPALLAPARQRLDLAAGRLPDGLRTHLAARRLALVRAAGRLGAQAPRARLIRFRLEVGNMGSRLGRAQAVAGETRRQRLEVAGGRLAAAFAGRLRLAAGTAQARRRHLQELDDRLGRALAVHLGQRRARLDALAQLLGGLSYRSVLERGFVLVRETDGRPLRRAAEVADGAALSLEFADGRVEASAGERGSVRPRARPAKTRAVTQGSLF